MRSRSSSSRPLSIGVVLGSASRAGGGVFYAVRRSLHALSDRGVRIRVYALRDDHSEDDAAEWSPLRPELFATFGPRSVGYAPGLATALAAAEHDVIHLHGLWLHLSVQVARVGRHSGRPTVVSPHGMLDPWALRNSETKKRLAMAIYERRNLRAAACLHALTTAELGDMRALGLSNPIAVIPNGVEAALPANGPPDRDDARRVLLFLGRIHPKKGVRELLDAWRMILSVDERFGAEWRLAIAGWDDGGHLAGLRAHATSSGLDGHVDFIGPLHGDAKARALTHCDAFVLPSHSEGLPMAVLEAWSYRKPVFMTDACNLSEGFREDAAVRIAIEPHEMARVLRVELRREDLPRIGANGLRLAESRFSWGPISAVHEAVYRWIRGDGPRPDCVALGMPDTAPADRSVRG